MSGHLDVVKLARENNRPWHEDTCAFVACNGHLNIIKWARNNKWRAQQRFLGMD
jgi:hypothetical protein